MRCNPFGNPAEERWKAKCAFDHLELNLHSEGGGIYVEARSDLLNNSSICGSNRSCVRP
jgi:hypothetical protein